MSKNGNDIMKLMNLWNKARKAWIDEFGTEDGFVDWFKSRLPSLNK